MTTALMIAAPTSGSGKTTLTLGILRALHRAGHAVSGAKSGPDYIDPRFHEAACAAPCPNLDAWAMAPDRIAHLINTGRDTVIIEGAMGLFDGAPPDGRGSCGALAATHGVPVVLVVDAARMAQSVRAIVRGFASEPGGPRIVGVILNRVGSPRHETMLRRALTAPDLPPVIGAVPRQANIAHPSRHLGLVQAQERPDLLTFLDQAADLIAAHVDMSALLALAAPMRPSNPRPVPPPAQRIAIAQDAAFAFAYPHLLADWRAAGAEILPFSPLADQGPEDADLIILPGGYPELYAGQLAANTTFTKNMNIASQSSDIYGECGGYMVLGEGLIDAQGTRHKMLGLLPLETSFATRKLHLGYRRIAATQGPFAGDWMAHEFHYATTLRADGAPLFTAQDAEGTDLPPMGLRSGRVCGSFAHLIDRAWT